MKREGNIILAGKHGRKGQLVSHMRRWMGEIKTDVKVIMYEDVNLFHPTQDRIGFLTGQKLPGFMKGGQCFV
jgi:hypothetical protein